MSTVLPADLVPNVKLKQMIRNEEPIQAFIFTKEHSPKDSQDDKILSQTL